jgi:hypothetical protein
MSPFLLLVLMLVNPGYRARQLPIQPPPLPIQRQLARMH